MSDASRITGIRGRRVWDSRGRPTVEADVVLAGGARGRAIAPAGASTGSHEALDRRDGGTRFGGYDVRTAVEELGLPDNDELTVTTIGDTTVRVQTRSLNVEEVGLVKQAIADELGIPAEDVAYSLIGASWGQQITQQALIVFGERDGRVEPASLDGYGPVANATVVTIPQAGHTPVLEAPERTAELIGVGAGAR